MVRERVVWRESIAILGKERGRGEIWDMLTPSPQLGVFNEAKMKVVLIDEERKGGAFIVFIEKSSGFVLLTCASGIWTGPCDMNVYDVPIFSCV